MANKKATENILRHFIKNEVNKVERMFIIAETSDGKTVFMHNDLTFNEVFALLKTADIEATQQYIREDE